MNTHLHVITCIVYLCTVISSYLVYGVLVKALDATHILF